MSKIKNLLSTHADWQEALDILQKLKNSNFQSVFAGGSVRDVLLGSSPKDLDIATSAKPKEILKILPGSINNRWEKYGVLLFQKSNIKIEITSFRKDLQYEPGSRACKVEYVSSIEQDSLRRDFTVNACYYDPFEDKIIDFVGGQKDISTKTLRAIGDPNIRFKQDKLRLLRAFCLMYQFKFQMEKETYKAWLKNKDELSSLSKDKVYTCLNKILTVSSIEEICKALTQYEIFKPLFSLHSPTKKDYELWQQAQSCIEKPLPWVFFGLIYFYSKSKDFNLFLSQFNLSKKLKTSYEQSLKKTLKLLNEN